MNVTDLLQTASAQAIGHAIARRQVSSTEATQWYLARIERFNHAGLQINAVRTISPMALAQAEAADRELAAGRSRGPLHGVPYLVKDNIFTADGMPASAGSLAIEGFVPPHEATVITRLSAAGAVLLGKTNMTEFADFVSDVMPSEFSGVGGVVRNPLGPRYDRGQGSSVGPAAAVAARFCAFALGSETQNSIQTPAVFSSIVGFKPTVGRVSRHGIIPLVPSQDTAGPLTVCVADAILVMQAIAGIDMRDPGTLMHKPWNRSIRPSLQGLRIGVPRRLIADAVMNDARSAAFERVLAALTDAGAVVVDPCDLPSAEQLHEVRSCVFRTEFKASLDALLETYSPCGMRSIDDIIRWNTEHPEAIPYGQSLLEAASRTAGVASDEYLADRRRDLALSATAGIRAALEAGGADVLLSPMTPAAKCTGKAGAPVVAIPAGADTTGAPFGITVYSEPGSDDTLLHIAAAIEATIGNRLLAEMA